MQRQDEEEKNNNWLSTWLSTPQTHLLKFTTWKVCPKMDSILHTFTTRLVKKVGGMGNSLVYGIDVAEFSAYMLNYQHCYFYWTICAGKSA